MTLQLSKPDDIYQRINDDLLCVVAQLTVNSDDDTLNKAQSEARDLLIQCQTKLDSQLEELKKNAEWKTFTIAFYGETNAGKSTIIETLRILLKEPSKLARQQAFRDMQNKYGLSEDRLQKLQSDIKQKDAQLDELSQKLNTVSRQYELSHNEAVNSINQLHALITEYKQTASIWQKLLNLFRKTPEEIALIQTERKLADILTARDDANALLHSQEVEVQQIKRSFERSLEQQRQESNTLVKDLGALADGEIIGDGRPDFTKKIQRYDFELDGQSFALLDVPGIEGNEDKVDNEIKHAVQTAHAVFYITNKAAPPQTGDESGKGTIEKIKLHLGAQTEVYAIFNKKITNLKHSLVGQLLTSEDEEEGLKALNEKCSSNFSDNYRKVFTLTAFPAFLASTDHFAPDSPNAKKRSKLLVDFSIDDVLQKSRMRAFLQLLNDQLIIDSQAKITRANFRKANQALDQAIQTLLGIKNNFSELAQKLSRNEKSAQLQLNSMFSALKNNLESSGEKLIKQFEKNVRSEVYNLIKLDISNDAFKYLLRREIESEQEKLNKQLPTAMGECIKRFQQDVKEILEKFEDHARELTTIYTKLHNTQLNNRYELKLDLDNGIKTTNLLAALAGGALLWWNPAGWVVMALSVAGIVVGVLKAMYSFFSSDYKKSQQRKSTDENLHNVTKKLHDSLQDGLKSALPDMQEKISLIKNVLKVPAKQANYLTSLLTESTQQLTTLYNNIERKIRHE